jgi:hypothetical protein
MYEILYFNNSNQVIRDKKMNRSIKEILDYLNDCLQGTRYKGEIMRQALKEMDWRQDTKILEGRRYNYKGFKNRVALDGSFSSYEYIQDALLRLQIGYDKKKIDVGLVMVTSQRSEKSKLGTTKQLVAKEMEMLHPTINLPIAVVLWNLGRPGELYEETKPHEEKISGIVTADSKMIEKYLHGEQEGNSEPNGDGEVQTEARKRKHSVMRKTLIQDQKIAA